MTFRLSPTYGLTTGHKAHEWFLEMMHQHEERQIEDILAPMDPDRDLGL